MAGTTVANPDALENFTRQAFESMGVPAPQAQDAASVLVWANLRGVDTHGVRNLMLLYVPMIDEGLIQPDAKFKIEHETPFSARVDGAAGVGMAAGKWAMKLAIEKAASSGVGMVAMRNSQHFGAAGYFAAMPLPNDMIGISLTGRFMPQGEKIGIVPTYASTPMFSTNPIALAAPTLLEAPYVLDMATSITPYNRVMLYDEMGLETPMGWGMDDEGVPTVDPSLLHQLLPLGGTREMGSHKGYGLAMIVEILSSVLSGSWSTGVEEGNKTYDGHGQTGDGHFFGAIRVDAFRPAEEFKRGMDAMIRALHDAPKEAGQDRIYVAGEIEYETEIERRKHGIPVPPNVQADIRDLADRFGLTHPF